MTKVASVIAKTLKIREDQIIAWSLVGKQRGFVVVSDLRKYAIPETTGYGLNMRVFADEDTVRVWKEEATKFKIYSCELVGSGLRQSWGIKVDLFSGRFTADVFKALAESVKFIPVGIVGPKPLTQKQLKKQAAIEKLEKLKAIQAEKARQRKPK